MEDSNVASRGIVHELLTKDNYKRWKTLMKNYLLGKNLWWVVEGEADVENGNQRWKNAEALHIIQLSCGSKIFDEISECEKAKDAWNRLGARYGSDLKAQVDIEIDEVDDTLDEYKKLYEFVEKGNSNGAKAFIKQNKSALDEKSASGRTILHVATMAGHVNVVKVLVIEGGDSLVTKKDKRDYTALALAAYYTGNKAVAECMVEKVGGGVREDLLCIENEDGEIPLLLAADKGHKQMTRYLYDKTPKDVLYGPDSGNRVVFLFERCIKAEIFDVALNILDYEQKELPDQQQLQLATKSVPYGFPALHHLAQTPSAFFSSRIQGKIIYYRWFCRSVSNFLHLPVKLLVGIRETYEQKRTHYQVQQILTHLQRSIKKFNRSQLDEASVYDAMLLAAKHGNVEFIESMTKANPSLLWAIDRRKRGVFAHAILCRKEKVFQLVHTQARGNDKLKYATDVFGNNLLHLAAHLGPSSDLNYMPGAALQMQRELQWFKAVEEIVDPMCKEAKNDEDKKPHELFTETHVELVKAGEKWAKDAANSFTLVGALIITIMFTAAFTVPGGNNQDTGVPIFLNNDIFTALVVADAISLFTSATSVLIFIWILTSRYAEKDFLRSLPMKLLFGLLFLFLSVVFMLVAFSAALVIILNKYQTHNRLFIGGAIFVSIPVIILVPSQLRLIFEIFQSTISNPISVR